MKNDNNRTYDIARLCGILFFIGVYLVSPAAPAAEPVCAQVKIEISQELTLERQAFDAVMRINNGLDNLSIDNVDVTVSFQDEEGNSVLATSDPNATGAKFYIRVDTMDNILDVSGNGTVAPKTTAEIHWLIIPSPGAAEDAPNGKLYFVGANLSYTLGGEPESVEVTPDFITVKPLPQLTLDYFLTREVRGDDPLTAEIEPIEPYTLGVRIKNNGIAAAQQVKIDSAQPQIVENEQGLLIGFEIIGSTIDGQPSEPVLLVDFGRIEGASSRVGRWQMTSTLAGEFVDFTATFSHADELGGAVTSLLEATNSHFLVKDVRVDLPGRDGIADFLAQDDDTLRVYESHGIDTEVGDYSAQATLSLIGQNGTQRDHGLALPTSAGFSYVKIADPYAGAKVITSVVRSDNKPLPAENYWISRTRNKTTNPYSWDYFVNLFDTDSSGSYLLRFDDAVLGPLPPVFQFIPDRSTYEGMQVGFQVEASDPNGDEIVLTASPLPSGADFVDNGDGSALFNWNPAVGQAGSYTINFVADDGQLTTTQPATITVNPAGDTDGDGMADAWELEHFGNLDRDGSGDFDGDGISDLEEYENNTDPASGPQSPLILDPLHDAEVDTQTPSLVVQNAPHAPDQTLTYSYQVFADPEMTQLVAGVDGVVEGPASTAWTVPVDLADDQRHYWRVRTYDGHLYSLWSSAAFFVNTANDAPDPFSISSPALGAEVSTLHPLLEVTNAIDIDGDAVDYDFTVYSDATLTTEVVSIQGIAAGANGSTGWLVDTALTENSSYYWQAKAVDEHGAETLGPVGDFFVNTGNDAPGLPAVDTPAVGSYVDSDSVDLRVVNAIDPDGDPLSYLFELDHVATFDSIDLLASPAIAETADTTAWGVIGLLEDQHYYWRVKAFDGIAESDWVLGDFVVNALNEAPSIPTIRNPGSGAWVATLLPTLEVNAASDPDGDAVSYRFELYADAGLTQLVSDQLTPDPQWSLQSALVNNHWYSWRVRAEDPFDAFSDWSPLSQFFTDDNGVDDTPALSFIEPAAPIEVTDGILDIRWDDHDPDSSATIALYYEPSDGSTGSTLIIEGLAEDSDEAGDMYSWVVTQVPPGAYRLYAVIDDGNSAATVYLDHEITIQATEITLDNDHQDTEIIGDWIASTAVSGFLGGDYRYHGANGPSPDALIVDNGEAGYTTLGAWTDSTLVPGYFGDGYQYHTPNGDPVGGIILDDQDPVFTTTGTWGQSTQVSGYEGDGYHYHGANGIPPSGIVMDNEDPAVQLVGNWPLSTSKSGYYAANYQYHGTGSGANTFTWPVTIDQSGRYHIYARWTAHANRASNAPFTITHDGGSTLVRVDQRNHNGEWVLLGSFDYTQGYQYDITLSDDVDGYVIADAIKAVPENAAPNTATWMFTATQSGQHEVYAHWTANAQRATNVSYYVTDDTGTAAQAVNQQQNGGEWNLLGSYAFTQGQSYPISLTDQADGGYVIADAVKVVPEDAPANTAIWHFDIPESGEYRVYGRWSAHANRATNAGYLVEHSAGSTLVLADQQQNGGQWNLLGTFDFDQGTGYDIRLTDQADGHVIADAIMLSPVEGQPNRFVWHLQIPASGEYAVYARWTAHPNRASDATYTIAHDGGDSPVTVDQRHDGAQWNLLGNYHFTQGGIHFISVTDEADGYVIADGILLVPVNP